MLLEVLGLCIALVNLKKCIAHKGLLLSVCIESLCELFSHKLQCLFLRRISMLPAAWAFCHALFLS